MKLSRLFFSLFFVLTMMSTSKAQTAPDFNVNDIYGNPVHLYDILGQGKHVVLEFYTSWCPSCPTVAGITNQAYTYYGCNTGNVVFIGINGDSLSDHDTELWEKVAGVDYIGISGVGGGNTIHSAYNIMAYPTMMVIAPDSTIAVPMIWPIPNVDSIKVVLSSLGLVQANCIPYLKADFSSTTNFLGKGDSTNYSDLSSGGTPSSWLWTFEGGTPSTSTMQNPTGIRYDSTGVYFVKLEVTNGLDTHAIRRKDYITVSNCTIQTSPFAEGFEGSSFPTTCWEVYRGADNDGTFNDWRISSDAHTGNQCAYAEYEVASNIACEDWMVTPKIAIPNSGSPNLQFYEKQSYSDDYGTNYYVKVSTTSPTSHSSFTDIVSYGETDFGDTYSLRTIDLSAYAGQDVYIAFVMIQSDGDDWFIDDIEIDNVVGIEKASKESQVSIFPNPTKGIVYIESSEKIESIYITNAIGQKCSADYYDNSIDLSSFEKGVYYLSITSESGTLVRKIVLM